MSSLAEIRTALCALLASVPDIGHVYAFERYAREEAKFRELYIDHNNQLRGWHVRRAATQERTLGIGRTLVKHTWRVRGYMALNDTLASELVFDTLIEALRDVVRADPGLGGLCQQNPADDGDDGLQVIDSSPALFCGVLCHTATLELSTWSYL